MSEWISVEERLPLSGSGSRLVIAFRPDMNDDERIATIFYDATMSRWGGSFRVTHWMPLPEPPRD